MFGVDNFKWYKIFSLFQVILSVLALLISSFDKVFLISYAFIGQSDNISLDFIVDLESILFFCSILVISASVFVFGGSYMKAEKFSDRFFWLLGFFVGAMVILTFSGSFFSFMIGWDGLGVTSFLLVIYFQSKNSSNAGILTILTNRLGDILIMISMGAMLLYGSWSLAMSNFGHQGLSSWLLMLICFAAFTKSAQIPFSSWLPAAMAAPTPVSSLVHSSTLVTAGVYLLIRFKGSFMLYSELAMLSIFLLGGLTMCMAGVAGLFENDFKKMVALSTLSQLGLMMSSLGLGCYNLAFFHLLVHAYFKALLFMATGSMIHSSSDYQDLRFISLPYFNSLSTSSVMIICNLSLMGMPFLGGFYSKDLILEYSMMGSMYMGGSVLFFLGTSLTVMYTVRFLVKSSTSSLKKSVLFWHKDFDLLMFRAFDGLLMLAVLGGSFLNWLYLKWLPSLSLSSELKNMTLVMIILTMLLFLSSKILSFLGPLYYIKWSFGMMMMLSFLSKSFMKKGSFNYGFGVESVIEYFFIPQALFKALSGSWSKIEAFFSSLTYNFIFQVLVIAWLLIVI